MTAPRLGLLLLGTLALASCGQQATTTAQDDPAAVTAGTPAPTTVLSDTQITALRARIAEVQALRDDVQAGRAAAPLDDAGQAIDLDALLRDLKADLAEGLMPLPTTSTGTGGSTLDAQAAPYASSTYKIVASTNTFRSRYSTLKSAFPRFVWTTDGCSGPSGYTGWSDEFYWPCRQHDFGYRNVRFYPSLRNETHRHWVDAQFKEHMNSVCDTLGWRKYPCYVAARAFYTAVYFGGKGSFY